MPYIEPVLYKLDVFRLVHRFALAKRLDDGTWSWLAYYVTLEVCDNADGRWAPVHTGRTRTDVLHRPFRLR